MTTLHYHRLYQISSLEANLSLEDMKQLCVDRSHIHTQVDPLTRAVGRSPKCIRKNPVRQIQKNLRNINWYSCYELFKTGKFHTFLVSFMILASCAE